MERLRKAKDSDLPNVEKLLGRAEKGMEYDGLPPFSHYYKPGDGLYVYADGARLIGVADASNSLKPLFKTNAAKKTTAKKEAAPKAASKAAKTAVKKTVASKAKKPAGEE